MLNVCAIIGRLVADPELRQTTTGRQVTAIRVAVDRSYGKEKQADFLDVVAWEKTAEFICKYFTKGSLIAVQGSIQTRSYEDKAGNKRTAVEIMAREVSFCESKGGQRTEKEDRGTGAPDIDAGFEPVSDNGDLPF